MKNLYTIAALLLTLLAGRAHAQIPLYNSYPSATATVYLDFDGHLVDGTSWNSNGPITCGPANVTNDQIKEIFNRVSEDYRPFNINITTDSTRYWSAPVAQRMRVVLTITSDWYGAAGGVSFVGSFAWGDNSPAFVFTQLLGYDTKDIAEATAHEIGHTLGLRHQSSYDNNCVKLSEYNAGAGSGQIGWAPIMGVGYYRNMTLWNNGANPYGCTNYQDDLSIITSSTNGFGYRTDDHGNAANGSATSLRLNSDRIDTGGIIERNGDLDVFKIALPTPGSLHLDAIPYSLGIDGSGMDNSGADVDLQLELISQGQNVLGTANPSLVLNASLDTNLSAGTYFVRVSGRGNAYSSGYASLGSYSLKGLFSPAGALALHQLELHAATDGTQQQFNWIINADERVVTQTLEVSYNGTSFQAVGTPAAAARSFQYAPVQNGLAYYRLSVTFDNGRQYYSNVVALRNNGQGKPALTGNVIYGTATAISPSAFDYTIADFSGRTVAHGQVNEGRSEIATRQLGSGMYVIRFSNGREQYTEKFIKQ